MLTEDNSCQINSSSTAELYSRQGSTAAAITALVAQDQHATGGITFLRVMQIVSSVLSPVRAVGGEQDAVKQFQNQGQVRPVCASFFDETQN